MIASLVLALALAQSPAALKELNTNAKRAFTERRYAEAAKGFAELHALTGLPEFLFNLATAQRLLGDCVEARRSYLRYLAALPQAANRSVVEEHLRNLERCAAIEPVAPEPVPPRPVEPAAEPPPAKPLEASPAQPVAPSEVKTTVVEPRPRVVAIALTALGGAGLATGTVLLGKGFFDYRAAMAEPVALTAQLRDVRARALFDAGLVVASVSAGVLLAGIIAWLVP